MQVYHYSILFFSIVNSVTKCLLGNGHIGSFKV